MQIITPNFSYTTFMYVFHYLIDFIIIIIIIVNEHTSIDAEETYTE